MTLNDAAYQATFRDVRDGGWSGVYHYADQIYSHHTTKEAIQTAALNYQPSQTSLARDRDVLWGLFDSVLEEL